MTYIHDLTKYIQNIDNEIRSKNLQHTTDTTTQTTI